MLSPASAEQGACVQSVLSGYNVIIEASAGAGKSTTFYHTASAWLQQHPEAPVLLVCFNAVLRAEAMRKVNELQLNVDCFTIHALAAAMYRTRVSDTLSLYSAVHGITAPISPAPYSLVLIDEAQDLNEDHADVINALQAVLDAPMQYVIVGDPRQEIYSHARSKDITLMAEPAQYLKPNARTWTRHFLNTSYRLTAPVCELLNNCFRDSATQIAIKPGNTRSRSCTPRYIVGDKNQLDLMQVLKEMLQTYSPGDIMILAPSVALTKHRCQQLAYALHMNLGVSIFSTHKQRSDLTPNMMHGKIFLSTYHQSKGYERKCVLVLGVDEHEWHLNQCPVNPAGEPMVHNALHVALTRAQEQLIMFQHYECGMYPTVRNLSAYANVLYLRDMRPRPPLPRSMNGELLDTWLVSFQPRKTLTTLLDSMPVADTGSTASSDSSDKVMLCKVTPDSGEDVMDAYYDAVLGWTERLYTKKASALELALWGKTNLQVPSSFAFIVQYARKRQGFKTARDWLAAAIIYNTMIRHDYPHELYQLQHLNWVGPIEEGFVDENTRDLLGNLPPNGYWHETATRMLDERPVRARVPFMAYTDDGPEPWQFTLNDGYTEHNLLLAMVHMWVFRAQRAHVYSMQTNTRHTILPPENLNSFLKDLFGAKMQA